MASSSVASTEPRRRRVQAWHVAALVLGLAVAALLGYAFWPGEGAPAEARAPAEAGAAAPPAAVEVRVLAPGPFALRVEATGHLAAWRQSAVSAEASGRVVARFVEEGQAVAAGAPLLRLDDRDLRLELAAAEADLLKARADYAVQSSRSAEVAPADTQRVAAARAALRQAEQAFAAGRLTAAEVQEARRRFEAATLLAGSRRGAVQAVMSGLTQAEQRIEQLRLALSRTTLYAPFAGRVADVAFEVGQHVATGQAVLTLQEDARLKVTVDALEADLVRVRPGAAARVTVPALDGAVLQGRVHAINPRVDPATGTGRIIVAVPNPQRRLLPGLFARVALETGTLPDRLVLPAEAVLERQGRSLVFRIEAGQAKWVYVTPGVRSGDLVEIVDGLAPGDTVAVAGHFALAHDTPVTIVPSGTLAAPGQTAPGPATPGDEEASVEGDE